MYLPIGYDQNLGFRKELVTQTTPGRCLSIKYVLQNELCNRSWILSRWVGKRCLLWFLFIRLWRKFMLLTENRRISLGSLIWWVRLSENWCYRCNRYFEKCWNKAFRLILNTENQSQSNTNQKGGDSISFSLSGAPLDTYFEISVTSNTYLIKSDLWRVRPPTPVHISTQSIKERVQKLADHQEARFRVKRDITFLKFRFQM